jgi:transketolase
LAELLVTLYHGNILRYDPKNPRWPGRDRFILSEGQAAIGIYPVLADVGFFPIEDLDNFLGKDSTLGVHSEPQTPGIEVLTGSLGHGIGIASGMAHIAKLDNIDKKDRIIMCLTGDGELCEGSNWEALITIQSRNLDNFVLVVNRNHQFTIGRTDCVETQRDLILDPLPSKLESFRFEVRIIDGHNPLAILAGFSDMRTRRTKKPLAVIANTIKGFGASCLADKRGWHYRVPKDDELLSAQFDLENTRQNLQTTYDELKKEDNQ